MNNYTKARNAFSTVAWFPHVSNNLCHTLQEITGTDDCGTRKTAWGRKTFLGEGIVRCQICPILRFTSKLHSICSGTCKVQRLTCHATGII